MDIISKYSFNSSACYPFWILLFLHDLSWDNKGIDVPKELVYKRIKYTYNYPYYQLPSWNGPKKSNKVICKVVKKYKISTI